MSPAAESAGRGCDVPPTMTQVEVYLLQKGTSVYVARQFYQHYFDRAWVRVNGGLVQDWKRLAWQWIWNEAEKRRVASKI